MAGLIVEDGTGKPDANSYATLEYLRAYLGLRGLDLPDGISDDELDGALVRGSEALDALFAGRWPGVQTTALQGLAWPRRGVFLHGVALSPSPLPLQLVKAACEAAWREAGSPGSMTPDYDSSQRVVSESVSSISVTYASPSSSDGRDSVRYTAIEGLLSDLLAGSGAASRYGSFYLKRA